MAELVGRGRPGKVGAAGISYTPPVCHPARLAAARASRGGLFLRMKMWLGGRGCFSPLGKLNFMKLSRRWVRNAATENKGFSGKT